MAKKLSQLVKADGQRIVKDPEFVGVHTVYEGMKKTKGKNTGIPCVVFLVKRKMSAKELKDQQVSAIPNKIGDFLTDVVQSPMMEIQPVHRLPNLREEEPADRAAIQGVRTRERPARAGVSYGHVDITTGTLGGWVHTVDHPDSWFALTNAHVGADINSGQAGDRVLQPGPFDGGSDPFDQLGTLAHRVAIRMGVTDPGPGCAGDPDPPKKDKAAASAYWKAALAVVNAGPRLFGCPFRAMVMSDAKKRIRAIGDFCIEQPWPNLVDACLVGPVPDVDVDPAIIDIGLPTGLHDPALGDAVRKHGRTTFHTNGTVVGLNASSQVSYGPAGVALFQDQIIIEGVGGAEFSAGGDSGSWILDVGGDFVVGLLFAGGGGITIANRASVVFATLGATL